VFFILQLESNNINQKCKVPPCKSLDLQGIYSIQSWYKADKTRETKRIYYTNNQLFIIFLYLAILPILACF